MRTVNWKSVVSWASACLSLGLLPAVSTAAPQGILAPAGADIRQDPVPAPTQRKQAGRWAQANASAHFGSSPFTPSESNDVTFVVDTGPGLDTACTYRSDSPLRFKIKTTRYVGETNADGSLREPAALVAAGVLGATAKLTLPVFDVDDKTKPPPNRAPEVDRIFFNGREIGVLTGFNQAWFVNTFEIPIELVRFPARGVNGALPMPMENEIRIDIDTANTGPNQWCTAVDWAALSIKALSPVILIHGNNSSGEFFERNGLAGALRARRVLYDRSILTPSVSVQDNGLSLSKSIPGIVRSFGVDSIHMIAHSKGGLDARHYLGVYQPIFENTFKVLSLTTLSSPHNGTLVADIIFERQTAILQSLDIEYVNIPGIFRIALPYLTYTDAYKSLSSSEAQSFTAANVPLLVAETRFHTVAADADTNANARIDLVPDEYAALRVDSKELAWIHENLGGTASRAVVDTAYQILRTGAAVTVKKSARAIGRTILRVATITAIPSNLSVPNDTLVTVSSARGEGDYFPRVSKSMTFDRNAGKNHSNVADADVTQAVLSWIFSVEREIGDLK